MEKKVRLAAFVCAGLVLWAAAGASANWSYDFNSGSLPAYPFFTTVAVPPGDVATYVPSAAGGYLRMEDTRALSAGGGGTAVAGNLAQSFSDVRVAAILNPTSSTSSNQSGVLARGNFSTGAAYSAGFNFYYGILFVARNDPVAGNTVIKSSDLGQLPIAPTNRSYYIQLDVVGNSLSAKLFDAPGGSQLLWASWTDTTGSPFASGNAGVFAQTFGTGRINETFDDISAAVIPEPATLVLCSLAAGWLIRRRRA